MKLLKYLLCLLFLLPQISSATDYVTKTSTATGNYTFSVDPNLGSSDTTISSQNAVKSYVDAYAAPVNGYLLTTRDVAALTNATNLGLLSTGLLKITVSGGIAVVATAIEGTDYWAAVNSQTANYFFAAPNGLAGVPTFRAIVAADLPSLASIYQPLDADLTYLASFTPSANVKTILNAADNAAIKTALGYPTSGDYQVYSATLASLAGLTETNGGIPYGTADNAYAWLAAGGSGKLLMGAGAAAPVWTTPTFPNAATTTGAYLRADGTNFIQSTLILPNAGTAYKLAAYTAANTLTELAAVGATGTVLQGTTGAIPAWSTSTYADTYVIGGLLHAGTANIITALVPGAVGSFLMSNGTGAALTYLAPGAANYQLVGAGVTTIPVWTASTGTGSPVLSAGPTFTGTVTLPKTIEIQDTSADHQYVLAVSELTADRTVTLPLLTGADEFVFKAHAQTLTNKTLTAPVLGAATATSINSSIIGWTQTVGTFTATPASTSTLTMGTDLTATILVGLPLKYKIGATYYYGQVTAMAANLLTVAGAPFSADVTELYYGDIKKVTQAIVIIPGTYEDASNTALISTDLKSAFTWYKTASYLVRYTVRSKTHDSTTHGTASVRINGTEVNTTAGGLTIAADDTAYSTVVDIAVAAYDVQYGEAIEITSVKAGAGDASDLTVHMVLVTP